MKIAILLLVALSAYGQTPVNASTVTLGPIPFGALSRWMQSQTTPGVTPTLAVSVDASTTAFSLSSGTGLGATSALVIDTEIVQCTAKPTGSSLTCTRAQVGTTAAAHSSGAVVKELVYKTPNAAATKIIADKFIEMALADATATAAIAAAASVRAGIHRGRGTVMRGIQLLALLISLPVLASDAVLTWQDTVNPASTQYNVYRAPGTCTAVSVFAKLTAAPITPKTYTDLALPIGTYCYQVTAFDSGLESIPSQTVAASIPPFAPGNVKISVTITVVVP